MQSYLSHLRTYPHYWTQLWQKNETLQTETFIKLCLRTLALILLYIVADRLLMRISHLPFSYYRQPIIYLGFLQYVFSSWYAFPVLAVVITAIYFRRTLVRPWTDFEHGTSLKFLVTLAAALLAWNYATYDYNLYFNRAHYADRVIILGSVILIYWRPVFVLPFLTVLLPVMWQFTVLVALSWAAPFLLLRLLTLFVACFAIQVVTKNFPTRDFVFLTGCLFAAHYWLSGWGKWTWEWVRYDQILMIFPYGYANGWLRDMNPDAMLGVLRTLTPLNGLFKMLVLLLEFGAFLFFYSRKSPLLFLIGWIFFHAGVLLLSGICFYMWAVLHLGLLWLFLRRQGFLTLPIFTRSHIVLSTLLIISGNYWCKPVQLFWYDLPFSYSYGVDVTTTDGQRRELPPTFFSPYDYQFIMSGLAYLASHPMVLLSDARKDAAGARKLMTLQSADAFFVAEKFQGRVKYDANSANTFDLFIKEFVKNWNDRQSRETLFSHFQAPSLLWNHRIGTSIRDPNPGKIARIRIFQTTSFFSEDHYEEVRKIFIYERAFE